MKSLLAILLVLGLTSCSKKPTADFSWDPIQPKIGQVVVFTNNSSNAKSYNWDFGNSNTSKDKSPEQVYNVVGNYVITLTSYNGMKTNSKTATLTVVP